VLHGSQFVSAGPGYGQQECGVFDGLDVVPDGGSEGEEVADMKIVRVAMNIEADITFENLERDSAVGMVLLHLRGGFHGDEDDSEVVLLEEGFGEVAGGPGLFLFGVGYLAEQVELCLPVDHGAVLPGGGHFFLLQPIGLFDGLDAGKSSMAVRYRIWM